MASGGEQVTAAAAGEETPLRKTEQGADNAELSAPSGWTKKVNPTRPGKFEVIFVAPTGEEIKTKRALTQYLKKNPGGPAVSEFNWGTGDTPRRSSRLSEKVKAVESSEDEKPAKRGRPSSSKKGKKGTQEDAEDEDEKPAKRGRPSGSKKGKKGKQEDAEEAPAESGDHVGAEEAKDTDVEMKDADSAQEEKKDVPMVDAAEKTEEAEVKTDSLELPKAADAAGKTEEAGVSTEVSELPKGADAAGETVEAEVIAEVSELPKVEDAAGKTEESEVNIEVSELPLGADTAEKTEEAEGNAEVLVLPSYVSAPVLENKGDGKPAESEVAPLEGEKSENGPAAIESTGMPVASSVEKKEEADSTINPVTPPPVEVNSDAPAAEAAKEAENSSDKAAQKDDQGNAVNLDNNGQIHPGASTVKCT